MKHYIVAYVNRLTGEIEQIAVSDGPILDSPIEPHNHADLDMHFCEVDSKSESKEFIRGRKFLGMLKMKKGKLDFKDGDPVRETMILNTEKL